MDKWVYTLTAAAIPLGYVGSLYLFDRNQFHPNHPKTIKRRFLGVALSTTVAFGTTYVLLSWNYADPIEQMGLVISRRALWNTIKSTVILLTIYLGTIIMELEESDSKTRWSWNLSSWRESLSELTWWKSIVVAPLTEELAFRGCSAVLLRHSYGPSFAIYVQPLFFSLCHYHHLWNDVRHGDSWTQAILGRSIQNVYTYLFGVYATYLAVETGNLLPAVLAHSVCNRFGLPRLFDVPAFRPQSHRPFLYFAHFAGLVLFLYFVPAISAF